MLFRTPTLLACCVVAISCAPGANAQGSGAIGGYTLGFVYDGRLSGLRPLAGIPGAAVLGAPLDTGGPVRGAFVAPGQNYAIALTDSGAVVVQFGSATDPPLVSPLGFDSSAASIVTLSPDGSAGAFYSGNEAVIRIVTGLPAAPAVVRCVQTAAISGTIRLLAISNDGAVLVAAVDGANNDAVVLLDAQGNGQTLTNSTHVSAMQFSGGADNLLVTDDSDDTLSLIHDVSGAAAYELVADNTDGIAGPVGVNTSSNGNLVVANGGAANVVVFDSGGSQIGTYSCPTAPAGLSRLNGNSVFLLNGISDNNPLWLFDGDSATPRVLFIPVDQVASSTVGQ
jgi:hypothetical protein